MGVLGGYCCSFRFHRYRSFNRRFHRPSFWCGAGNLGQSISEGALLYHRDATTGSDIYVLVQSVALSSTGEVKTVIIDFLSGFAGSIAASSKLYLIGNVVNEGSDPRADSSRTRTILSNKFSILRKDVNIAGTMAATDMHAVPDELRHQIRNRLLEMQRELNDAPVFSQCRNGCLYD